MSRADGDPETGEPLAPQPSPSGATPTDRILGPALGVACAGALAAATGLVESGAGFSPDVSLRLQTEALLDGRLALQPLPFDGLPDWAWGRHGLYQLWGIGIPLLRMPFDLAAQLTGAVGFPDRWVFLATTAGCVALLHAGLSSLGIGRPAAALATAFVALFPTLLVLVRSRFGVYEEVVAYGCVWTVGLLGGLLCLRARPSGRTLVLLAAACGFAPLLRLSTVFAAAITGALALGVAQRARVSGAAWLAAASLVAAGPAICLALNSARFGDPFEFGYRMQLQQPAVNLMQRFSTRHRDRPLGEALSELAAFAFPASEPTGSPYAAFDALRPEDARAPRFGELYFAPFPPGAAWAAGLAFALWAALRLRRSPPAGAGTAGSSTAAATDLLVAWAVAQAAFLVAFYTRTPAITSRYLAELYPALAALLLAGGLSAAVWARALHPRAPLALAAAVVALAGFWLAARQDRFAYEFARPVSAAAVADRMQAPARPPPEMPLAVTCQERPRGAGRIWWNLLAWVEDCRFASGLQVVLPASPCVELRAVGADAATLRLRSDLRELERREVVHEGERTRVTFCEEAPAPWRLAGLQLLTIWREPASGLELHAVTARLSEPASESGAARR